MKRSFLIVFPNVHLPYSPTVLNIFYALKKRHKVTLIAPEPNIEFSSLRIDDPDIVYISADKSAGFFSGFHTVVLTILAKYKSHKTKSKSEVILTNRAKNFIKEISKYDAEIIAVDFFSLVCAQRAGKVAHLVSLEILENDIYYQNRNLNAIRSVLIQTEERFYYLFNSANIPKFIVQNSPKYIDFTPEHNARNANDLVYCGTALPEFGFFSCLDFLKDFAQYRLTIKGAVPTETMNSITEFYQDLINEKRLIIDSDYLDPEALTKYISKFRIGFVFYDFYRFRKVRSFNYYTAPSGKMFQYFNSGVPVIGNILSGLKLIEDAGAGILISHLSSINIKNALAKIEDDYAAYSINSKNASKSYDFSENATAYLNFLESN